MITISPLLRVIKRQFPLVPVPLPLPLHRLVSDRVPFEIPLFLSHPSFSRRVLMIPPSRGWLFPQELSS